MPTHTMSFVEFLLKPDSYHHSPRQIELVQTHISWVFLAGDYVYKFKKPVNFGFLDFSSPEKRRFCCEQELKLNQRLCPEIYLGLVALRQEGEKFTLCETNGKEEAGKAVEYGVKMRRMPEERMMPHLLAAGALGKAHIDALVEVLVPFYEQAATGDAINGFGTAEAVAVNVLENFDQLHEFIGPRLFSQEQFDCLSQTARNFLGRTELFQKRIEAGRIRDCHGDLYSANICLAERPWIFDCIEFNERFRYIDVACDVAFLAMDLDYHGQEALAQYFIRRFVSASRDSGLDEILNFYKGYRACVRGKINFMTAKDPAVDASLQQKCLASAARYFKLAERYARGGKS